MSEAEWTRRWERAFGVPITRCLARDARECVALDSCECEEVSAALLALRRRVRE